MSIGKSLPALSAGIILLGCGTRVCAGPIDNLLQEATANDPQKAVAAVIEQICPPGNLLSQDLQNQCDDIVVATLIEGNVAQGQAGLQGMAPEENSVVHSTEVDTGKTQRTDILGRLSSLRTGTSTAYSFTIDGKRMSAADILGTPGETLSGGGASADPAFSRLGVFVNGNFGFSDKDATSRESGFNADNYGVTGGADYRFTDQTVLGISFGYSTVNADLKNNGGKLDTDGYTVSAYGSYTPSQRAYVNAVFGYTWNTHDQNRTVAYTITAPVHAGTGTVNQQALSSTDSREYNVNLEAGYDFYAMDWTLTPYGRFDYAKTEIDGYSEHMSNPTANGSGLAVAMDSQNSTSVTATVGGRVSRTIETHWGYLYPQAGIEYVHEFDNNNKDITGHFVDDSTRTVFRLPTDKPDRNYGDVTAGLTADFRNGWTGHVVYQGLIGYRNLMVHAFEVGMRLDF